MMSTVTAALLVLGPPPLPPEPGPDAPSASDQAAIERAEGLYRKGSTLYESAEYPGAIAAFTEALAIVQEMPDAPLETKLSLLYNIASAHERAYEIDGDVAHLRQALKLYQRYEADSADVGDQLDAGARRTRIETTLRELETAKVVPAPEPSPATPRPADDRGRKHRDVGIGLLVPGVAAVIGGVVVATVGSTYESRARDEVAKLADLGVPPDHPAWIEGDDFIAQERRKGAVLMGVGGAVAAVGAVGVGVGAFYLVKSKRARHVAVAPQIAPGFAGLHLAGRF